MEAIQVQGRATGIKVRWCLEGKPQTLTQIDLTHKCTHLDQIHSILIGPHEREAIDRGQRNGGAMKEDNSCTW